MLSSSRLRLLPRLPITFIVPSFLPSKTMFYMAVHTQDITHPVNPFVSLYYNTPLLLDSS